MTGTQILERKFGMLTVKKAKREKTLTAVKKYKMSQAMNG